MAESDVTTDELASLLRARQVGQVAIGARGRFVDLRGADLRGADLRGADLGMVYLSDANLSGADLSGADLSDADLSDANLSRADLSDANLSRADLSRADLSEADLSEAEIRLAGFIGAKYDALTQWPVGFDPRAAEAIEDTEPPRTRQPELDTESQVGVRSGIEPVTGHLERLYLDDKGLDLLDQEFLRAQLDTIKAQLRPDEGGVPQIIEIAIATIVKRFINSMQLGEPAKAELLELGATEELAQQIVERVNEALTQLTEIGQDDDPKVDAELLQQIADNTEAIADGLEVLAPEDDDSGTSSGGLVGDVASGAAKEVGRSGVRHAGKRVLAEITKRGGWNEVATSLINNFQDIVIWLTQSL